MPVLKNSKHELFAQGLAKGKSQSDAYVDAGYAPSVPHASRLATNGNVVARVAELQGRAANRVVTTIEDIAKQLDEDREFARRLDQPSAAVSATMGKAKVLGLIVDRAERSGPNGGPQEHVVTIDPAALAEAVKRSRETY